MNEGISIQTSARIYRYFWMDGDHRTEGYRIHGSAGGNAWISADDAWDIAHALADLLDEDAEKGRA